jgi:hypothetical protein
VRSTPSLSNNRFSVLPVYDVNDTVETHEVVQMLENPNPDSSRPAPTRTFRPRWERHLPSKLIIASAEEGPNCLKLEVSVETTDTGEVKSVNSLVDCGATGEFIDRDYVKANRLRSRLLSEPIPVFNIDGTPNEAGSITEVVDLILRYKNHSERVLFAVTGLGKQKLVLGHSWLRKHNPEIDWATGEVKMSRCSPRCCSGCRDEVREERKVRKAEIRRMEICSAGPDPKMVIDCDEIPELEPDCEDDEEDDEIEDGD